MPAVDAVAQVLLAARQAVTTTSRRALSLVPTSTSLRPSSVVTATVSATTAVLETITSALGEVLATATEGMMPMETEGIEGGAGGEGMEGGGEAGGEKKDPAKGINLINKNATNAIIVVAFLTGLLFICLLVSMSSRGEVAEPDVDLDDHSELDAEKVMLIAGGQPSYNANGTLKEIAAPVWTVASKAADGTTRQRTNMGAPVPSREETIANKAGMAAVVHHN